MTVTGKHRRLAVGKGGQLVDRVQAEVEPTWMMSTVMPLPTSMLTEPKVGACSWSGLQTQGSVACCAGHRSCGVTPDDAEPARAACNAAVDRSN